MLLVMTPLVAPSAKGPGIPGSEGRDVLLKIKGVSSTALMEMVGQPIPFNALLVGSDQGLQQASTIVSLGPTRTLRSGLVAAPTVGDPMELISVANIDGIQTVWVKPRPDIPDISALAADPSNVVPETDTFFVREFLGVNQVNSQFGINGTGTTVAVVDTGTDFSNPDLHGALNYVNLPGGIREPLILDADESQILLLKGFTAFPNGTIPTKGVKFTTVTGDPFAQSTTPTVNYAVNSIPSMSGVYRFGITQQAFFFRGSPSGIPSSFNRVGVLLYDPVSPGDYTAARVDLDNNKNFTDDAAIDYLGDRVSSLDTSGGGFPDRTAGTLGGFFHDIFLLFGPVARYLPGWDRTGHFLSIFYDNNSHGTATAGHVGSRGVTTYNLDVFGPQKLPGIAPGAKILAVKGLTVGNVEGGMLFAAGFDVAPDGTVFYTGSRRADIISNSWGISTQHYDLFGFGFDFESMFENGLAMPGFLDPNYPGIIIVHAAGNGNFGYGTITSPGSASFVISVGASTSLHTTANLFGFSPEGKIDDIIHFSARGPTPVGELKPDVANVGAFAWDIGRIFEGFPQGTTIFSGTSEATPLTAGVVALMLQATNKAISDPFVIRNLLQSTAKDLGYNPLAQANGRVDAYRAVLAAKRLNGETPVGPSTYSVSSRQSISQLTRVLGDAWALQWGAEIPDYFSFNFAMSLPPLQTLMERAVGPQPSGSLYLGRLGPGESEGFDLNVRDLNNQAGTVTAQGLDYSLIGQNIITDTVSVPTPNPVAGGPAGINEGQKFIILPPSMFTGSTLTQFNLITDFSNFDPDFDYTREYRYRLWVFDWVDSDGDGIIQAGELRQFNYGFPHGTSVQTTVADLTGRLSSPISQIVVRVDMNRRSSTVPAATVPFTLTISKYTRVSDPTISFSGPLSLPANGNVQLQGTITVPAGATPGVRERMVEVTITTASGTTVRIVPVSFSVVGDVGNGTPLTLTPANSKEAVLYDLGAVRGSFDWSWRYESGDWRVYTVRVSDSEAFALQASFTWTYANTTIDIFVLGGDGQFAGIPPGSGTPYSRNLGAGIFRWHSIVDSLNQPLQMSVNLAQTRYILNQFGQRAHSQVFTIYIHEVLHAGKVLSETITGTAQALKTEQRLAGVLVQRSLLTPVPVSTSITLPFSVSPSPGSPAPANTTSLSINAFSSSSSVTFTPTLPQNLATSFAPNTMISTDLIQLQARSNVPGTSVLAVSFATTIPDLRVFTRRMTTFSEFAVASPFPQLSFSSPIYIMQDWTVLAVRLGGRQPIPE
jgi:subtilisin family serine protease